jgi:hypothetical protein
MGLCYHIATRLSRVLLHAVSALEQSSTKRKMFHLARSFVVIDHGLHKRPSKAALPLSGAGSRERRPPREKKLGLPR